MSRGVILDWPERGEHVLMDGLTGKWISAGTAPLPVCSFTHESSFGAEKDIPFDPGRSNLLIRGENLLVLRTLIPLFQGKVDFIYLDPPFNSRSVYSGHSDNLQHRQWLSMMEERLLLAKDLLRPGGILALHTDREEQPYARILLDEIFSRKNMVSQISWQRAPDRTLLGQGAALINDCVEYIAVYSNGPMRRDLPTPQKTSPLTWKTIKSYSRILRISEVKTPVDTFESPGGVTAKIFAHAAYSLEPAGFRNLRAAISGSWGALPEVFPYLVRLTNQQEESTFQQELLRRMPMRNCLYSAEYTQTRGKHRGQRTRFYLNGQVVLFLKDVATVSHGRIVRVSDMGNFWTGDEIPTTGIAREGGVAMRRAKKPERLLQRLVEAFSREGDLVLDFFAGSGTTGAVAHKLKRRWIMVDASPKAVSMAVDRMKRVVEGTDATGISRQVCWEGGGGFKVWSLNVPPIRLPLKV